MDGIYQLFQRVFGGWDMPAVSGSSWWMGYASCVREFLVDGICQLCQRVLGGWDVPAKWALCDVVPFFTWRDDVTNCGAMKRLYHVL